MPRGRHEKIGLPPTAQAFKPVSEPLLSIAERQRLREQQQRYERQRDRLQAQVTTTTKTRMGSGLRRSQDEIDEIPLSEVYHLLSPQEIAELEPVVGMGGTLPPISHAHRRKFAHVQSKIRDQHRHGRSGSPTDGRPPISTRDPELSHLGETSALVNSYGYVPGEDAAFRRFMFGKEGKYSAAAFVKRQMTTSVQKLEDPHGSSRRPSEVATSVHAVAHQQVDESATGSAGRKKSVRNGSPVPLSGSGGRRPGAARTPSPMLHIKSREEVKASSTPPPRGSAGRLNPLLKHQVDGAIEGSCVRPTFLAHLRSDAGLGKGSSANVGSTLLTSKKSMSLDPLLLTSQEQAGLPLGNESTAADLVASNSTEHPGEKRRSFDGHYRVKMPTVPSPSVGTTNSQTNIGSVQSNNTNSNTGTSGSDKLVSTDQTSPSTNSNVYYGYYGRQDSESMGYPTGSTGGGESSTTISPAARRTANSLPTTLSVSDYGIEVTAARLGGSTAEEDRMFDETLETYYRDAQSAQYDLGTLDVVGKEFGDSLANTIREESHESEVPTDRAEAKAEEYASIKAEKSFRERAVLSETVERSQIDETLHKTDWNAELQALLDRQCITPHDARQRGEAIRQLWDRFRDSVLPVIETIICERNSEDKRIPLQAIGGVAGGDKYVFGNVFIKFCATKSTIGQSLYGSYEAAIKSASHERKGLNAIIQAGVPHLYLPLGMVVTYLGQRVWVASKIPTGRDTLKYGSRDGAKNIAASDTTAHRLITDVATALNLKEHYVGQRGGDLTELPTPVDLEVHCGHDGRYYVLDTARLCPPDGNPVLPRERQYFLYRHLRPERVRANAVPLSSDALSPFGHHNRAVHDGEAIACAQAITETVIPRFVQQLPKLFQRASVRTLFDVKSMFHDRGVNLRYLGAVLDQYLKFATQNRLHRHQPLVTHLASEMVARAFKVIALRELFDLNQAVATPAQSGLDPLSDPRFVSIVSQVRGHKNLHSYHVHMVKLCNLFLKGDSTTKTFWDERVIPTVRTKFPSSVQVFEMLSTLYCRDTIEEQSISINFFHPLLLQKVSKMLGLRWAVEPERDAMFFGKLGKPNQPFDARDVFSLPLLRAMEPVVKVCEASPYSAVLQAVESGDLATAERLYNEELHMRQSSVDDPLLLVPLLKNITNLLLLSEWGKGMPRRDEALQVARRVVMIYQDRVDADEELQQELSGATNQSRVEAALSGDESSSLASIEDTASNASTVNGASLNSDESEQPAQIDDPLSRKYATRQANVILKNDVLFWTPERIDLIGGYVEALADLGSLLVDSEVDEALEVLVTAARLTGECSMLPRGAMIHAKMQLGTAWKEKGRWVSSHREYRGAAILAEASFRETSSIEDGETYVNALCAEGEQANELGQKKEAIEATQKALHVADELLERQKAAVKAAKPTGALQRSTSTGEAEDNEEEQDESELPVAVTRAQAVLSDAQVRVEGVTFVGNLARHLEEAKTALAILDDAYAAKGPRVARARLVLAQLCRLAGNFREGVRLCEEALSGCQQHFGLQSSLEAVILIFRAEFAFLPQVEAPSARPQPQPNRATRLSVTSRTVSPVATPRGKPQAQQLPSGMIPPEDIPKRYVIAEAYVRRALEIFTLLRRQFTPQSARAATLLADIIRVSGIDSYSAALALAQGAVRTYEEQHVMNSRDFVHAVNVTSLLRLHMATAATAREASSTALQDLYVALSASDRFMSVADADFYTMASIAEAQQMKGTRTKPMMSRDALLRRMEGHLQLAALHTFFDEHLNTAMAVKTIMVQFRELFAVTDAWNVEAAPFLPKLMGLAEWLLRGSGGVASPVTDLGNTLLKLVNEERAKASQAAKKREEDDAGASAAEAERQVRVRESRLNSQLKQAGLYLTLGKVTNGLNLLHAAVVNFGDMYPKGATKQIPHSVTSHNLIVKHVQFTEALCREPDSRVAADQAARGAGIPTLAQSLTELKEKAQTNLIELSTLPRDFTQFPTPQAVGLRVDFVPFQSEANAATTAT